MISVRAMSAAVWRSVEPTAETDATTTGAVLKLNAPTVGSTPFGRLVVRRFGLDRGDGLVEVGAVVELGEDERERVGRRRAELGQAGHAGDGSLDGLRDLLGHVRGAGAGIRRDDGDDRERDVGQQLLLQAAPGEDAGDEEGGGEEERDAPLRDGELGQAGHDWLLGTDGRVGLGDRDRVGEDLDGALDHVELAVVEGRRTGRAAGACSAPACARGPRRRGPSPRRGPGADWPGRRSG